MAKKKVVNDRLNRSSERELCGVFMSYAFFVEIPIVAVCVLSRVKYIVDFFFFKCYWLTFFGFFSVSVFENELLPTV